MRPMIAGLLRLGPLPSEDLAEAEFDFGGAPGKVVPWTNGDLTRPAYGQSVQELGQRQLLHLFLGFAENLAIQA